MWQQVEATGYPTYPHVNRFETKQHMRHPMGVQKMIDDRKQKKVDVKTIRKKKNAPEFDLMKFM